MRPLLEVIQLHYYYGNIHSIKGIDLYVNEGEMVTLIGANGAGKTTTLQTISGLTPPAGVRGEVIFNGQNIQKKSGHKIAGLGLMQVLEGRQVFSRLSVEENLYMGAYLRKDRGGIKGDLGKIYKLFPRLEERSAQMAGTLSGGEQQMLAIGRAMINNPKMVLMDEPSLGLAPLIIREIFAAIRQINYEGTTILFVEQNSKIALSTAHRGYVVQTGEIVMSDTGANLLRNEDVQKAYMGME
jgi:branched-chain amino acid transport system ATP-binding protein